MEYGQTNEFYDRSLKNFLEEKNTEICHTGTVGKFDEAFAGTQRSRVIDIWPQPLRIYIYWQARR